MPPRGATQDELRRHNLSAVLRSVHRRPLSRTELAAALGLNRSTIGALVTELAARGLVVEALPAGRAGAGRPSLLVQPSAGVHVLAAEIGVESVVVATVGLGGVVTDRAEVRRARGDSLPTDVAACVADMAAELDARRTTPSRLVGVGASVAGVVRREDGLVHFGPNLGWREVPFGDLLAAALGVSVPVAVGNDADLGALAEHVRGVAEGLSDVVYLSAEVGVGGGIIVDGRPLYGSNGYGGEVGHMVVNPLGNLCRCGARGCWETEVGEDALLIRAGHPRGGGQAAVLEVLAEAGTGWPDALAAIESVGQWLGSGIATLINLFNPDVVVMGGLLTEIYPAAAHVVAERLSTSALDAPRATVQLALPALRGDSSLVGAAELAFAPLLDDPLQVAAVTPFVAG